ncbi:cytochrome c [Phenylobacterium sp.]|uniref:c-type cytochrome n=1 Tax=Phenylobacterium sp. TaxID=1871053 RepID=UPI00121EB274|nr:cytochrome c [Phenylobacterium sp.]THD60391.1 MAG: cytochrome c [Phenylobacterium sp.]
MKRSSTVLWAAAGGACLALSVAFAAVSAGNPVEDRQATMKAVGQAMKEGAGINSPATFDAAKAKTLMDGVAADAKKLHGLYPAGSDKDPKTAADPKIWDNKADFDKRLTEMATLASTAGKATTADAFKPAYAAVGATCKSCHDLYRKKKS